jgi:transposase
LSMAKAFRRVDRDQAFLLPPDMADWLPDRHLVWFVISVVDELDMTEFEDRHRLGGAGRAAFDPRMLLALLIYAYAVGQRSSRQIERLCTTDVGFRVICAQDAPDHTTIARFRQVHHSGIESVFTQVLLLCAKAGLGRVGVVAIDGTKIAANAAASASHDRDWLAKQAARILGEAAAVDAAEDAAFGEARGDELPEEWTDPRTRAGHIRAALEELKRREQAGRDTPQARRAEADRARRVADAEAGLAAVVDHARARYERYQQAAADAAAGRGKPPAGRPPVPPQDHVRVREARDRVARTKTRKATARDAERAGSPKVNLTDPDSRLMPSQHGWVQGFNAQLAVTDDQIILAAMLTQTPVDVEAFVPMMGRARDAARLMNQARARTKRFGVIVADAGYLSRENLTAPGPDRLIALGKRRDQERAARDDPATGPPPEDADPIEVMGHRLRTAKGIRTYRRRGVTVEPVNGHLKDRIGLRRFARRGLPAANNELQFAAAVANLLKLHRALAAATS